MDLAKPGRARASRAELQHFLEPGKFIPTVPTDGIVKETAMQIVSGATSDVEKARVIYE